MGHEPNSTPSMHQTNPLASSPLAENARHGQSEGQVKLGRVLAYIISLAQEPPTLTEPLGTNDLGKTDVEQGGKNADAR